MKRIVLIASTASLLAPAGCASHNPLPAGASPAPSVAPSPAFTETTNSDALVEPAFLSTRRAGWFAGAATDPSENLLRVTFSGEGGDFDPAVSPDGSRLYFSSTTHRATPDIYVKSVDGRAITQLTNDPASDVMPAVSPDGRRLAFASDRTGSWNIYVMSTTGGQAVQITSDAAPALHPSWSPDGRSIVYCKLGEVSRQWEIWIADLDHPGVHRYLTRGMLPDWRPTDGRIAFQRARERGGRLYSIWTLDYRSGEAMNLSEVASHPTSALVNPKWSRDGEFLAFAAIPPDAADSFDWPAPQGRTADIWIMHASSGACAALTRGQAMNFMPAWGPADSVYFVSDRAGRRNIWSKSAGSAMAALRSAPADVALLHPAPTTAPTAATHAPTPARTGGEYAAMAASATPAPAQPEQDSHSDMANAPIDDHEP